MMEEEPKGALIINGHITDEEWSAIDEHLKEVYDSGRLPTMKEMMGALRAANIPFSRTIQVRANDDENED
jgi:hypothetical protein